MSDIPAIRASGLSKKFCPAFRRSLFYAALDIVGDLIPGLARRDTLRKGEFWALRDVGFTVKRGEALAVIGHNGAGKSTLLKVLYGLLQADAGSMRIEGKVVGLIELGAGINPLLTGRENIVLVAALHGLSRSEALGIVDEVLDFAELDHVADIVVQMYSTGMRARLSYAIAAVLRPAVLLVDEVLAVGDFTFQRKCITHLQRFLAAGGALLLVSHAPYQIQAICSQAILLDHGEMIASGDVAQVMRRYLELRPTPSAAPANDAPAVAPIHIESIVIDASDGGAVQGSGNIRIRMDLNVREALQVYFGFTILSQDGWTCITASFDTLGRALPPGATAIECSIARLPLVEGRYLLRPLVADSVAHAMVPLAGTASGGVTFDVTRDVANEPDMFSNARLQMGQLVAIETEWVWA
jgi:lipopolysaccharide transport system ATP-binding protein